MNISNTEVYGFRRALHGMRNPMNSWSKSDSVFTKDGLLLTIGENDKTLASKLIKAGTEHRKFLRFIHVQCFMTLPRYIWTEMDTYKVATTRLSCSTMHKLGSTNLTLSDFQDEIVTDDTLISLNYYGNQYRVSKDVTVLRRMKQILPEGFLQSADMDFNYETLMNIYHQRKAHRMSEWSNDGICKWIESLPMMNEWLKIQ